MNKTKVSITIEVECWSETFTLMTTRAAFPGAQIDTLGDALEKVMFEAPAELKRYGFSQPKVTTARTQSFGT